MTVENSDRMTIPEGETHKVLIAFREEISIGFFLEFCHDMNPTNMEYRDDYGIVATIEADDNAMAYIDDRYDHAISMMCDIEQKVNGEPMTWRVNESETRVLPIIRCGNSLAINVTPVCALLGLDKGDMVKVKIEKLEE